MGVKKEVKTKWRSILQLFIPYSLCVIVPIAAILLLGMMMMNSYKEKLETSTQNSIERAFERVQMQLDVIANIALHIGNSEMMQAYSLAATQNSSITVGQYREIISVLQLFEVSSDVMEIYLYDDKENRIISTENMLSDAEKFFEWSYPIVGMTAEESLERLQLMSGRGEYHTIVRLAIDGEPENVIEYSVRIPFNSSKDSSVLLVIAMKEEDIFRELSDIVGAEGEYYVYDRAKRLLLSKGDLYESQLETAKETALMRLSGQTDSLYGMVARAGEYKLKAYVPDLHDDSRDSYYILLLMLASTTISIVICIFFTIENKREIEDILALFGYGAVEATVEESGGRSYGYLAIRQNVDRLVRDHAKLFEQTSRMNEMTKYQFLYKLLHDESGELLSNRSDIEPELKDDKNLVLCIRYEGADYRSFVTEDVMLKDFVKLFIKENIDREIEILDSSSRETVCVIYGVDGDYADVLMRELTARLNIDIFHAGKIPVFMGVSDVVDTIFQLHEAYSQAKEVIQYRQMTGKNVLLYSELRYLSDEYYYPKDYDELLNNYLTAGKDREAKQLLDKLYQENVCRRMLTLDALDVVKNRIAAQLNKLAEQYEVSEQELVRQLKQERKVEEFFSLLRLLLASVVEGIRLKKNTMGESIATRILDYIYANYADSSLSLTVIAHELGFQKDYISKLFKTEYGENLSVVLEKIRIEKACELLREGDVRIVDVSEAVGYNSDISFRRAFKKVTGLTPVEYKSIDRLS